MLISFGFIFGLVIFKYLIKGLTSTCISIFDKDVSIETSLQYPELYLYSFLKKNLNFFYFVLLEFYALLQALVIFFFTLLFTSYYVSPNGHPVSDSMFSVVCYSCMVLVANGKLALITKLNLY
jgi:hypothetical protein